MAKATTKTPMKKASKKRSLSVKPAKRNNARPGPDECIKGHGDGTTCAPPEASMHRYQIGCTGVGCRTVNTIYYQGRRKLAADLKAAKKAKPRKRVK